MRACRIPFVATHCRRTLKAIFSDFLTESQLKGFLCGLALAFLIIPKSIKRQYHAVHILGQDCTSPNQWVGFPSPGRKMTALRSVLWQSWSPCSCSSVWHKTCLGHILDLHGLQPFEFYAHLTYAQMGTGRTPELSCLKSFRTEDAQILLRSTHPY